MTILVTKWLFMTMALVMTLRILMELKWPLAAPEFEATGEFHFDAGQGHRDFLLILPPSIGFPMSIREATLNRRVVYQK
jgi:hypothetical protein